MTSYPVGNQVLCFFAFTSRALTYAEGITFLAGGGLPSGVGVAQTTVQGKYSINGGAPVIVTGAGVVNDAVGAYHIVVTLTEAGTVKYQGYSLDGSGNPVAATVPNIITATPF